LLILLSDGDTVPATGMPTLPASISDVLVVGVGDPRAGTFIDGRQSRQDASALRQIATRLNGTYFDANEKHLPTDLLNRLTIIPRVSPFEKLTRREYALIACGAGATVLAFLPLLLRHFGTAWRPGVGAGAGAKRKAESSRNRREKEFGVSRVARVG
jgi:Ca-activated chloride channel family protein